MTQWNTRATWLMGQLDYAKDAPTVLDQARQTMSRWRQLCEVVPARALAEAAHVGLQSGRPADAVRGRRCGVLVLSGPVGIGKTVAAAWAAYRTAGACLWLNAVDVAISDFDQQRRWLGEVKTAALVVLDDVGAGNSGAEWAAPKIAEVIASLTDRRGPSIVNTNMSRGEVRKVYSPRVLSRIDQQPNVWVDCPGRDRRKDSTPPPGLDVLPPREARALRLMHGYQVLGRARQAKVIAQVDAETMIGVARDIGIETYQMLDERVDQSARRMAEVQALMADRVESLQHVLPADDASGADPC